MNIPFNKPYLCGKELHYISQAVMSGKISGNGDFTKKCHEVFENRYGINKALLTTSCTDALEMSAILGRIKPGDEVIVPSYTFVSTALAFVRQGANIIFCDSRSDHPGIDEDRIEELLTPQTVAVVPVHYAGVACDMDKIMALADRYNLLIIEDAAQSIDSYYKGRSLGSIGHLATFSFHETKNINSGEGGLLAVNSKHFVKRSEIIWEKGTNRADFFRGEVNKYGWVDTGSSFLPSEIISAYLYAQLEYVDLIQSRRVELWNLYYRKLVGWASKKNIRLPYIPEYATNNGHMFYLIFNRPGLRDKIIKQLKKQGINSVFHYQSLHNSPYYKDKHDSRELKCADYYSDNLLRLPYYNDLSPDDQIKVIEKLKNIINE